MTQRWLTITLHGVRYQLLNLDYRPVEQTILGDIDAGVEVYYDRRWPITQQFALWLQQNPALVADRTVFIPGAGVGLETLVIGRYCRRLYVNDLSDTALALCHEQLRRNGIRHVECRRGRYETLALPPVDKVIGSYLVYNSDTRRAMARLLDRYPGEIVLMNDALPAFKSLLKSNPRRSRRLFDSDAASCVQFPAIETSYESY